MSDEDDRPSLEKAQFEAILGEADTERHWEYAIVLQGPYNLLYSSIGIRILLENNDPATVLIIVSTYLSEAEKQGDAYVGSSLSEFEQNIVIGKEGPHVGRIVYLFLRTPNRHDFPDFWRTNFWNQNLQRFSTFTGLRFANDLGINFALKCRTDSTFAEPNICRYMQDNYLSAFPLMPGQAVLNEGKLHDRIVVNDWHTVRSQNCAFFGIDRVLGPFHVCDMWQFGHTSDLMTLWDVREGCQWDGGRGIETDTTVETHVTKVWMREVGIVPSCPEITEIIARYFVVANSERVQFIWLKGTKYQDFQRKGRRYLLQVQNDSMWFAITRHETWLKYRERYRDIDSRSAKLLA